MLKKAPFYGKERKEIIPWTLDQVFQVKKVACSGRVEVSSSRKTSQTLSFHWRKIRWKQRRNVFLMIFWINILRRMTGGRGSSSRPCHLPPPPPAPHQLPVMFFPKKERMRKGIRFSLARCGVIYFYFCKCHHHHRHHHHHSRILVCSPPAQAWPTTPRSWRWKEGQRFSPGCHWASATGNLSYHSIIGIII